MINFGSTVSPKSTKSIVNHLSAGGDQFAGAAAIATIGKILLSGETTANVYKALVTVTGPGVLKLCYVYANDATSRTISLKVSIDGTDVFDAASDACTTQYNGLIAAGTFYAHVSNAGDLIVIPDAIPFNSSLIIYVKSSIAATETNKLTLGYAYETR